MMNNVFSTAFPTISRLLASSKFEEDVMRALELASSSGGIRDLKAAFNARSFRLNDLMLALCGDAIFPYPQGKGRELEQNLAAIVGELGFDKVRSAYRNKLLIDSKDKYEDVRYEIAVAAKACRLLDAGSLDLEAAIEGTNNDSDVRGTHRCTSVRLEVTVIHETLPPVVDERLENIVLAASVPSGFFVSLRRILTNEQQANRTRVLIEKLHEHDAAMPGADATIDGLLFEWRRGSYHCDRSESLIVSAQFDLDKDMRRIERPVFARSLTPQHMIDDFDQPRGIATFADALSDSATQNRNPLSGTIRQKVVEKLRQCEEGAVNIVVLGNPFPMSDNAVYDALYGVLDVQVPFEESAHGVRHSEEVLIGRDPNAPFMRGDLCPDPSQFVDPFRTLSAVWLLRLDGGHALSRCLPNPNASSPVPQSLAEAIDHADTYNGNPPP